MSDGDRLTGRYFFALTSVVHEVSVEVWSRQELALQSKTITDPDAGISEGALVFKGLTDGFSMSGVMDVIVDKPLVGGGMLSYAQAQTNRQNFDLWVEVELAKDA
jgi:hypothetical protein